MRIVVIFLCVMFVVIAILLFSYNRVLEIGHERQCGRLYENTAKIEECVSLRKQGIRLELREKQDNPD